MPRRWLDRRFRLGGFCCSQAVVMLSTGTPPYASKTASASAVRTHPAPTSAALIRRGVALAPLRRVAHAPCALDPEVVIVLSRVRVVPPDSQPRAVRDMQQPLQRPPGDFIDDVLDGLPEGLTGVVVPKLASTADVDTVVAALDAAGHANLSIVAGLETVAGVVDARTVTTHPRVGWCYFGAEDYVADLGGVRRTDNLEVQTARAQVAQAARLGGIPAIDMVVADFGDAERLLREAEQARSLGFSGKKLESKILKDKGVNPLMNLIIF